ncbi:hypothetical protein DPMN_077228 [Dreissena polymorpha]|uniref:Uncharacterized protein n=1 Tax=Dreissena polymorpha TaxID=45954 RepID=A0A9D3YN34_DREPO|nr:hypothetical protein DPMN_077228 [Dreissena polymorpha]
MLAMGTVHGTEYTISSETTDWNHASCKMVVPDLMYTQKDGWHIDTQHLSQLDISSDGVWIGYINATVAFEYLGCLHVSNPVETQLLNNIGDCNLKCNGNIFGVKKDSPTIQGVICTCIGSSDDMTAQSCTEVCDQNFICGKHNKDNFYKKTKVSYTSEDDPSSNCLIFRSLALPFKWQTCRDGGNPRLLCSIKNSDGQWVAYSMSTFWSSWVEANEGCLSNKTLPATLNSILKGKLSNDMNQPHWTGVIRTHTVLMADDRDFITRPGERTYSFVTNSGKIYFEGSGKRSSLCTASPASTTTPTFNLSTTINLTEESTESKAMGIGIGISVAVICIVGAIIAILVLKKRQVLPCSKTTSNSNTGKHTFDNAPEQSYDDLVNRDGQNANYSVLGLSIDCADGKARYYNTERDKDIERETNDKCNSDYYNTRVALENVE